MGQLLSYINSRVLDSIERTKTLRRKYERSYKPLQDQMPYLIILTIFLVGIIFGSLFSNSLELDDHVMEVSKLIDQFIGNINSQAIPSSYLLIRSFMTYSKPIIFIWLFGLFPITIPFIGLLIGIQGFSYGFTTSFLIIQYNLKGFLLCLAAYGVQGTLFVIMIFILSGEAIRFGRKDKAVSPKVYLLYLLVAILGVGIISLYESYVVPVLIQQVIVTFF